MAGRHDDLNTSWNDEDVDDDDDNVDDDDTMMMMIKIIK